MIDKDKFITILRDGDDEFIMNYCTACAGLACLHRVPLQECQIILITCGVPFAKPQWQ